MTISKLKDAARAAREWLFEAALPFWWEHGFDREAACFHESIALDGKPTELPRRIRVQARQTAVYAYAGKLGWPGPWRDAVAAGAHVLLNRAVRSDGGTRHTLDQFGAPLDERRDLYDLAFVIFGLATAAQAWPEPQAFLSAADDLADWVLASWALPQGGFREGDVTPTPPHRQNPHMHMFEALLALHEATGDRKRLDQAGAIAELFETKLYNGERGALPEYFDDNWRPQSGEEGRTVEPGHLFEWSWLLHRWHSLGGRDLRPIAERLRVFGEVYGVDPESGGVFDEVFIEGNPRIRTSRLWPHTERLKANLACYERARDADAADAAGAAFDMVMSYCATPIQGLWRDKRLPDGAFVDEPAPASSFYHIMLAMFELMRVAAA